MLITGIGGVGKSALVARFQAQLPENQLLLWLDFDRADLAPDDAVSVLDHVLVPALRADRKVTTSHAASPELVQLSWDILSYEEPKYMSSESISSIEGKVQKFFKISGATGGTVFGCS